MTDIGEYLVGAYLKVTEECDFVNYNVRPPGGRLKGLGELDVIGFKFKERTVYLCEVTTHIKGTLYGSGANYTIKKISEKYDRQRKYYNETLKDNFDKVHYMFWSPVVPKGKITEDIAELRGLELVINEEYSRRINKLIKEAKGKTNDEVNPAFRLLQILNHMKKERERINIK